MPNDIKIEEHPAATRAVLQKGVGTWYLAFTGPAGFDGKIQAITKNAIVDAIDDGLTDESAIAYIQLRIAVAGYVVQRRTPPRVRSDAAEWTLTYVGRSGAA